MNKQNKILLGILAFVVACTIGYALFSENITINGTATASGNFELTTTCVAGYSSELDLSETTIEKEVGYKEDSCTVSGNTATFESSLEYPTASRIFTIKVTNTGTIPALFLGSSSERKVYINDELVTNYGSQFEDVITNISVAKNGSFNLETDPHPERLEPGDSYYFVYLLKWNNGVTATNFKIINEETMNYSQITAE